MSGPKFMVFKLKDLRIPLLFVVIAVLIFVFLLIRNKTAAQTFAPFDTYEDGKYIAGITLSDADMDLVVEIKDRNITNVSLSGLDETSSVFYSDLISSVDYINTYVTATQSLELPQNVSAAPATQMLMDALKVALSKEGTAQISSTYEKKDLTASDTASDIWVDEFEDNSEDAVSAQSNTVETQGENLQTPANESAAQADGSDDVVIEK